MTDTHTPLVVGFKVYGIPQPKGSTRAFVNGQGAAVVTTDNPSLAKWESAIRYAAETVVARAGGRLLEGALAVDLTFYLPRPKSAPIRRRLFPTTRPDLDKAARAVLDPLTGILYHDDAQVIALHARKFYTEGPACVEVAVREARALEDLDEHPEALCSRRNC